MARRRRGAGSESAGYHFDATPKRPTKTRTPVKAPPRTMAAKAPAGDYSGADRDFAAAVASLPAPARKVTTAAVARDRAQRRERRAANRQERRQRAAAVVASVSASRRRRQAAPPPVRRPDRKAIPETFRGKPTAGTPSRGELQAAAKSGTLDVNHAGAVTTPRVRRASQQLHRAERKAPQGVEDVGGIQDPAIRKAIVRYGDRVDPVAARYGISGEALLSKLVKGESGEDQGAVSSASAKSITQFIPSTREDFVNRLGVDPWRSKREAVLAATMHLDGKHGYSAGLEGYNPGGGQDYVSYILGQPVGGPARAGRKATPELREARKAARKAGLRVGAGGKVGPAPRKVVTRYRAIKHWAGELEKARIGYVYGGGHNGGMPDPAEGLDCSSSTVWVLRKAGIDIPNIVSGDFGRYLKPGPGAVTVFYNPGHVFMRIGDRYFGTSRSNPGSGPGFIEPPSQDYLAGYNVAHVPGLGRKEAIQLGIDIPAGGTPMDASTFPGMTLSSSGTTAHINDGAGVTKKGRPGFSSKPIRLTPLQRLNRNKRKLRQLGVPLGGTKSREPDTHPVLQEMIDKYGSANPVPTTAAERKAKAAAAAR